MKKDKQFDCVQMKWDIQQQLAKEFAGITEEEAYKAQIEKISKNSRLAPFLTKVAMTKQQKTPKIRSVRV